MSTLHIIVMSVIIEWLVSKKEDKFQSLEANDAFLILLRFEDLKTHGSLSSKGL